MHKPLSDSSDEARQKRALAHPLVAQCRRFAAAFPVVAPRRCFAAARPVGRAWQLAPLCVVALSAACATGGGAHTGAALGARPPPEPAACDTAETSLPVLGNAQDEGRRVAFAFALQDAARDAGLELRGDGRLAEIARELANGPAMGREALTASARAFGVPEVAIEQRIVRSVDGAPLARLVGAQLLETLRALHATHFGAFIADDGLSASVVIGRRPFTLAPVPRRVAAGATLVVRGRLAATYRDPKLVINGPSGVLTLPAGEGPEFELRVPMRAAGDYQLSLQATTSEQKQAVATCVVNVGGAVQTARAAGTSSSSAQLAQALYARSAALRTEHGVAPLRADAGLQLRAEHESAALAAGGAPEALPAREGSPLYVIARGRDERALWEDLVRDPTARARLQSADLTHVGFGVTKSTDGYVAVGVLAQLAEAAADDLAPARVLSALNQNRRTRDAVALRPDPQLTRVAGEAAREFFTHPERDEREIMDHANHELDRFGLAYGRVTAVALLVADPLEAAVLEPALDPNARAVGIAVARGERADGAPGGVAVVIALGWERSGP